MQISKKICLLGDFAVGKTSLVRRFVYDMFEDKYLSTLGVKVSRKTVSFEAAGSPIEMTMMLWDLNGSMGFDRVRDSYLRGAAGAVLVCDLTRAETLGSLQTYADHLAAVSPGARLVMAANKNDLVELHQLTPHQLQAVAADLQAPCYLTSAKTGERVEEMFRILGQLLLDHTR